MTVVTVARLGLTAAPASLLEKCKVRRDLDLTRPHGRLAIAGTGRARRASGNTSALRDGRILGLIEVADPIDGSLFSEADANAVFYVAERFAEFVSEHGLLLGETPAQN